MIKEDHLSLNIYNAPSNKWKDALRQFPLRAERAAKIILNYKSTSSKLLDVGCSDGSVLQYLCEKFPNYIGVDIDEVALSICRKRGLKVQKIDDKLPFPDRTFDIVTNDVVLEHVKDPHLLLMEICRVLKPDGILYITTANKYYPIEPHFYLPFLSYLPKKIANWYLKFMKIDSNYDDINLPSYRTFCQMIKNAGFDISDITLDIIENYKQYRLDEERGYIISIVSLIIRFLRVLHFKTLLYILTRLSLGWIIIAHPQKRINS